MNDLNLLQPVKIKKPLSKCEFEIYPDTYDMLLGTLRAESDVYSLLSLNEEKTKFILYSHYFPLSGFLFIKEIKEVSTNTNKDHLDNILTVKCGELLSELQTFDASYFKTHGHCLVGSRSFNINVILDGNINDDLHLGLSNLYVFIKSQDKNDFIYAKRNLPSYLLTATTDKDNSDYSLGFFNITTESYLNQTNSLAVAGRGGSRFEFTLNLHFYSNKSKTEVE